MQNEYLFPEDKELAELKSKLCKAEGTLNRGLQSIASKHGFMKCFAAYAELIGGDVKLVRENLSKAADISDMLAKDVRAAHEAAGEVLSLKDALAELEARIPKRPKQKPAPVPPPAPAQNSPQQATKPKVEAKKNSKPAANKQRGKGV